MYNFEGPIFCNFVILTHYKSELNYILLLQYIYLVHLVTLQIWINDMKYNQH